MTLKSCGINFLRKEICRQRKCGFYGHYIRLHRFIFRNFICVQMRPMSVQIYRKHEADIYKAHRQRSIIYYLSLFLIFSFKQISCMLNTMHFQNHATCITRMSYRCLRKYSIYIIQRCHIMDVKNNNIHILNLCI